METLTVALWAINLEPPATTLAAWLASVEARMAEAQAAGARLLVLPEFACAQWLSFAPPDLPVNEQVPWLPSEQNPAGWLLSPGSTVNVILWEGLRLAIVVCLDVEFTSLWARLAKLDLDLVLVPAKTDMLSGYYRVFGCAKARAIELQTIVCAVGAVGMPLGHPAADTVVGGAAAFLPCEAALGHTGIAAALEPHAAASGLSPMLYAPDLPIGFCRRIRHGAAEAEVWPGSWAADRIKIIDPANAQP